MPSTYSPTASYTGTLSVPNGDPTLAPNYKVLCDRLAFARSGLLGQLVWDGVMYSTGGGSNSGNTGVYVGSIARITLVEGSTTYILTNAASTQLTTGSHFASGTLANDTWYYVYALSSGGALTYLISVQGPDSSQGFVWRTGSEGTHRYLGCFRTNGSGVALPFRAHRGVYRYRLSAITPATKYVLSTSTEQVAFADLILAPGGAGTPLAPPHARMVALNTFVSSVTQVGILSLRTKGDTTDSTAVRRSVPGYAEGSWVEIETDSSQTIQYSWNFDSGGGGTGTAQISFAGFSE